VTASRAARLALATLALLLVLAGLGALWLAQGGRARRSGAAVVAGLEAPVEVRFDAHAVPAIGAASTRDAMAALGWLHANDRLFQMEVTRRAAAGRLAELFGERALAYDTQVRRLGFPHAAERLLAGASPETRELLDAYSTGVNAWLAERDGDLPPEFRILRRRPEPWRPVDSVGVIYVMARTLSPVVDPPEYELFELLRAFGPERARELAVDPEARIFDEVAGLAREAEAGRRPVDANREGAGLGSNNWAVGPERSRDGDALLANDPHLGLGLPNVWYQARIRAPDYDAAGMTFPGAPAVVLGRGPAIAWACTNLYIDDVDVFLERVDPSGERVLRGEAWIPIERQVDEIRVGDRTVEVEVERTDRGAFLAADPQRGLPARSVAWTGYEPGDQLAAFVALARAGSVDDVPAAVAGYTFPAQNLVVAGVDGRILWTPLGRGPRRFGWDGRFPAPAWRTDVGWDGLVPAAENPVLVDPPGSAIATANSTLPVPTPEWFGEDFDSPYRVDRIRAELATRRDWTVESLAALELDARSLWAATVVRALGDGYDGDAGRAAAALAAWDGTMAEEGPSALFALLERELQRRVFEDEAAKAGVGRFGTRERLDALLARRIPESWFDDVATSEHEDRHAIVAAALATAWEEGARRWGDDVATWRYGEIHTIVFDHALGGLPLLGRWWNRGPWELPGSATTILAFGGPWKGDAIDVSYGPSMRFVTDAARPDSTLAIAPGGQAGHPADPHYDDRLADYLAGRMEPVAWSEEAIARATVSTLRLEPAADGPRN